MPNTQSQLSPKIGKQIGRSGTIIQHGIITSEEYNKRLIGQTGNKQYEIMRRSDSTIHSMLQIIKLPLLSTTWDIDPVKQEDGTVTPEDKEKAAFLKRELMQRNINWFKFLKDALTCFDFGHAVMEKEYELTTYEGKTRIGIKSLQSRKQVSIQYWVEQDDKPGITQQFGAERYYIPRAKLIYFTHDQEGDNYEGTSLLRYVYKDWDIKDKLMLVNAMALEKLGIGVPVISAKDNQTPAPGDQDDAIEALMNMRANEASYLKLPATMTVEMLDMKGNETKDVLPTLNYLDSRIMKSIIAGFTEIGGASGSGSQSLAEVLTSFFFKSEEAAANEIVGAITDDLIHQLMDLNYTDNSTGYPKLTFGSIADDDNAALAESLSKLMTAGAITADAEIEDNLRERLRIPLMSKEDRESYKAKKEAAEKALLAQPIEKEKTAKDAKTVNAPPAKKDVKAMLAESEAYRGRLLGALAGA